VPAAVAAWATAPAPVETRKAAPVCGACLNAPPAFDATVVACDYRAPADRLVLALKFAAGLALAPWFARMLEEALARSPAAGLPDLLVPVPLGAMRLAGRGYNQALEIARPLARSLGVELAGAIVARWRETAAQSLLHPDERRQNVRGAFIVRGHDRDTLRGLHVGVVDDVMTTGETLDEIAALLKRHGAVRVTNLVFARTMRN
jgi:ComF family protein